MKGATPATLVSAAGASPWEAALVGGLLARHSGVQVLARCFDVAQVLAAVARVKPDVVLVGHDLEALDREVVAQLAANCGAVVGAYPENDPSAVRRLIDIGCRRAVPHELDPLDLAVLVRELAGRPTSAEAPPPRPSGLLAAVWGPTGAPGRTTVAVGIAAALATSASEVLVIDADTYGASVAHALGLPEQPSVVTAVHQASIGAFDAVRLRERCQRAGGGLWVLAGVPRADVWPEVREASLRTVLDAARSTFPLTVVDTGFCLEEDEELSYSGAPLRRNMATRTALAESDAVVAVCRADPLGMRRYLDARSGVEEIATASVSIVLNRAPAPAEGRRKMEMSLTLERVTGSAPVGIVRDDPAVVEALWEGTTVVRSRPRSPAARALVDAAEVALAAWRVAS